MDTREDSFFLSARAEVNRKKFENEFQMKNRIREVITVASAYESCVIQSSKDGRCFIEGDFYYLRQIMKIIQESETKHNGRTRRQPNWQSSSYGDARQSSSSFDYIGCTDAIEESKNGIYDGDRMHQAQLKHDSYQSADTSTDELIKALGQLKMEEILAGETKKAATKPYASNWQVPETVTEKVRYQERSSETNENAAGEEIPRENIPNLDQNDVNMDKNGSECRGNKHTDLKTGMPMTSSSKDLESQLSNSEAESKQFTPGQQSQIPQTSMSHMNVSQIARRQFTGSSDSPNLTFNPTLNVDGVVNAANERLMHEGGVAGAMASKAGNLMTKVSNFSSSLNPEAKEFFPKRSPIPDPYNLQETMSQSTTRWYVTESEPYNLAFKHTLPETRTKIFVYSKDITALNVDCVVNMANERLMHGGEVAGAVAKKTGYSMTKEWNDNIRSHGPLKTGEVKTTSGGDLCSFIIHAIGPAWYNYKSDNKKPCLTDLFNAFKNSFIEAVKLKVSSIAVPAMSSGIFGVPLSIVANVLWDAIFEYDQNSLEGSLREIHLVIINDEITSATAKKKAITKAAENAKSCDWNPKQYYDMGNNHQKQNEGVSCNSSSRGMKTVDGSREEEEDEEVEEVEEEEDEERKPNIQWYTVDGKYSWNNWFLQN